MKTAAAASPVETELARDRAHLIHALKLTGKRYGLGSACIGGGQGIAVIIESLAA